MNRVQYTYKLNYFTIEFNSNQKPSDCSQPCMICLVSIW